MLLNSSINLKSTVLKVAHHGSSTSNDSWVLNVVAPKFAVICVGAGNDYGHPHWQALSRLQSMGTKVYRTDLNGDIVFKTDGSSVSVSTDKQGEVEPVNPVISATPSQLGKYVGSIKSDKYHLPTCKYAEVILKENQIWFDSKAEAVSEGFKPCGVCKP